jgi:chromosome segregation ATPase
MVQQIQKDDQVKEDVLNENKANSAAMEEMTSQRAQMQWRMAELESQLQSTTEQRDDATGRLGTFDQRRGRTFHEAS